MSEEFLDALAPRRDVNRGKRVKSEEWLEQYLAGKMPLHAGRLVLPEEEELAAAEAEFDKMVASRKRPARRIPLWPWATAAAAMLVVAYMLWPAKPSVVTETIEQSIPQPTTQPIVEEKKEEVLPEVQQMPQPAKKHRKAVKKQSAPVEEPLLAETEPQQSSEARLSASTGEQKEIHIPADKQALADIFLAEEALQVAYELRAQQEAIRAYAASLNGKELSKPIIAF